MPFSNGIFYQKIDPLFVLESDRQTVPGNGSLNNRQFQVYKKAKQGWRSDIVHFQFPIRYTARDGLTVFRRMFILFCQSASVLFCMPRPWVCSYYLHACIFLISSYYCVEQKAPKVKSSKKTTSLISTFAPCVISLMGEFWGASCW